MKLLRFHKALVWLLAVFALQACEDEVTNLRNLDLSPRLVVNAYISPQDTELKVKLQITQPAIGVINSYDQLRVTDATVTLSDGVTTVALAYDPDSDTYKTNAANLPVVSGKTYFLKAGTPGGFRAEASCTVPSANGISLSELEHKLIPSEWNPQSLENQFSYKWTDDPNTANYYRAMAYLVIEQPDINNDKHPVSIPFYLRDNETKSFVKDQNISGGKLKSPDFYTGTQVGGPGWPRQTEFEVHALLIVSDKNYFLYHQSVYNQSGTEDNPFAEPTFIYSNVQGGLGVFGAFIEVDTFITVKE